MGGAYLQIRGEGQQAHGADKQDPLELERRRRSSSEHGRKEFQENHLKAPSSLS